MDTISFKGWVCKRCGHKWVPQSDRKPRVCPKCKTPYWDIPRANAKAAVQQDAAADEPAPLVPSASSEQPVQI